MTEPQYPEWLTRDIRPADGLWRALFFGANEPGEIAVVTVAGWLVQVVELVSINSFEPIPGQPPLSKRTRRIAAGVPNRYGVVEAVDECVDYGDFWRLVAPGCDIPDSATAASALDVHLRERERDEFDAIAAKLRVVEDQP